MHGSEQAVPSAERPECSSATCHRGVRRSASAALELQLELQSPVSSAAFYFYLLYTSVGWFFQFSVLIPPCTVHHHAWFPRSGALLSACTAQLSAQCAQ